MEAFEQMILGAFVVTVAGGVWGWLKTISALKGRMQAVENSRVLRVSTPGAEDGLDKLVLEPMVRLQAGLAKIETLYENAIGGNEKEHARLLKAVEDLRTDTDRRLNEVTTEVRGFKTEVRSAMGNFQALVSEMQADRKLHEEVRDLLRGIKGSRRW